MSLLRQAPIPGTRSAALQRIRSALDSLAPSERRVGEAILDDPGTAIALSISEFAERCGVAQPTLSRFAKNVGFAGYPALRLGIAHDFAGDEIHSVGKPGDQGTDHAVQQAIRMDAAMTVLAESLRLATAVEIWSSPEMSGGGELLAAQLRALGVPAAASARPSHWSLRAAGLPAGATVLLLSNNSADLLDAPAVAQARLTGAVIASAATKTARSRDEHEDIFLTLPEFTPVEMLSLWLADAVTRAVRDISNIAGPLGPASPWLPWPHRASVYLATDGDPLPAILLHHGDQDRPRSLIVYLAGMHGSMDGAASTATRVNGIDAAIVAALLNAGHQVLVTENPAHGHRKNPWESPTDLLRNSFHGEGVDLLAQSREEATQLVDAILALGLVEGPQQLAVVGQSWGGQQALQKMVGDPRIACGVAIMPVCDPTVLTPFADCGGLPRSKSNSLYGPLGGALASRPLLLISGQNDDIAPAAQVSHLEDTLRPQYAASGRSNDLEHVTLPGVEHNFDPAQIDHVLRWLATHLTS